MRAVKAVHVRAALVMMSVLPTFAVARAWAQECSEQECGPGYVCETSTGISCRSACDGDAGQAPAAPTAQDAAVRPPPSTDGGTAYVVDGGWDPCSTTVCEPHDYHYCAPAPCTADSECPSNMRCHTTRWQECSGGGGWECRPGTSCDADGGALYTDAGQVTCTERSASSCTLRVNLPCQADADCGEGYECAESRWFGCSGSGTVADAGDAGWIVEDAGSSCEWYPGGSYCKLLELPCEDDSTCPDDMRCQPSYQYEACDASIVGDEADAGRPVCGAPVQTGSTCQPWYGGPADAGAVIGGGGYADAATPPGGSGTGSVDGGGGLGGAPQSDAGAGPGASDAGDNGEVAPGDHNGSWLRRLLRRLNGSGGCSVNGSAAHGNLSWLSLLALALLARRRRS